MSNHRDSGETGKFASKLGSANNLVLRVASAAVLGPLVLVLAYMGGWLFFLLCAAAAAGILWEWTKLVADSADARILIPGFAALLFALVLTGVDEPEAAAAMIFIGSALAAGVMAAWPRRFPARNPLVWGSCGIVYAGIAFLGPALIRRDAAWGFVAVLFVAANGLGNRHFRLCGGPHRRRPIAVAAHKPEKDLGGRHRRCRRGGCRRHLGRLCERGR